MHSPPGRRLGRAAPGRGGAAAQRLLHPVRGGRKGSGNRRRRRAPMHLRPRFFGKTGEGGEEEDHGGPVGVGGAGRKVRGGPLRSSLLRRRSRGGGGRG